MEYLIKTIELIMNFLFKIITYKVHLVILFDIDLRLGVHHFKNTKIMELLIEVKLFMLNIYYSKIS